MLGGEEAVQSRRGEGRVGGGERRKETVGVVVGGRQHGARENV